MRRTFLFILTVFLSILIPEIKVEALSPDDAFTKEREMMAESQLMARGIKDAGVLKVMRRVKRHLFIPLRYRDWAYQDSPVPIGEGQTISQPYIVALMTELLELKGKEKILEVGTGSGYQAAVLAELAKEVYTIEILEPLARRAERLLKDLGYRNIYVKQGDGYLGWPQKAPFDAIVVTCAAEEIPQPLLEQLAEGGRLVIPVGSLWQDLKLAKKINGKIIITDIAPVRFVPMLRERFEKMKNEAPSPESLNNLKRHVKVLSQDIGERNFVQYENLEKAATYIKNEFKGYGYNEVSEQNYNFEGRTFRNIIATKKGSGLADKIIIICAHYDSVMGSPGADDNASGVAGLLELARLIYNENPNRTIRFIAFVNEEPPFFMTKEMGSFRYAQEAKRNQEKILGVWCLESIGYYSDKKRTQRYPIGLSLFYPDRANFIAIVSDFSSRHLLKEMVKGFKKQSSFPIEHIIGFSFLIPEINFSDHWSFWKFGFPAIMITDSAFYRYPYYHLAEDTAEKLDYESISMAVEGLYKVLQSWGNEA